MSEVADFLHACSLPQYIAAFHRHSATALSSIQALTEDDYNELGVKLGHRRKLAREMEKLNRQKKGIVKEDDRGPRDVASSGAGSESLSNEDAFHATLADDDSLAWTTEPPPELEFVVETYDFGNLPGPAELRKYLKSFEVYVGTLFFLLEPGEIETVARRFLSPESQSTCDAADLGELCAMSAIGAQFTPAQAPEHTRHAFHKASIAAIGHMSVKDEYRRMRLYACIAIFLTMEKSIGAKTMILAGLRIARRADCFLNPHSTDSGPNPVWKKLGCTLVTLDCWFSSCTGSPLHVTSAEIDACRFMAMRDKLQSPEKWYSYLNDGCLIRAIIFEEVYTSHQLQSRLLKYRHEQLDEWQRSLPRAMQLNTLLADASGSRTVGRSRVLQIHLIHLSSISLLYRRSLISRYDHGYNNIKTSRDTSVVKTEHTGICINAAEQAARVVALLRHTSAIAKRCWLVVYMAFEICTITLTACAQRLANAEWDLIGPTLKHSHSCIDMLDYCGEADPTSLIYANMLRPIYVSLQQMVGEGEKDYSGGNRSRMLRAIEDDLVWCMEDLCQASSIPRPAE